MMKHAKGVGIRCIILLPIALGSFVLGFTIYSPRLIGVSNINSINAKQHVIERAVNIQGGSNNDSGSIGVAFLIEPIFVFNNGSTLRVDSLGLLIKNRELPRGLTYEQLRGLERKRTLDGRT